MNKENARRVGQCVACGDNTGSVLIFYGDTGFVARVLEQLGVSSDAIPLHIEQHWQQDSESDQGLISVAACESCARRGGFPDPVPAITGTSANAIRQRKRQEGDD